MRDVQLGNLDVQLPVSSTDEVGTLTDSFNFFVKELRSKEQNRRFVAKKRAEGWIGYGLLLPPELHQEFKEWRRKRLLEWKQSQGEKAVAV